MSQAVIDRKPEIDWLTVVAIAAIAISFTVAFHEGVHALTCLAVGGHLQEYSALYAECDSRTELQSKIVAGSAPTYNLIAGIFLWIILRKARKQSPETRFFCSTFPEVPFEQTPVVVSTSNQQFDPLSTHLA